MPGDSRKLMFEGRRDDLVTMRPSDVPTYVEAGAADIGITGKDVLLEQAEPRRLRAARPRLRALPMVVASRKGGGPGEPLRRLGIMRIATKYPRVAAPLRVARPSVEVVEVKGSVELAPLVGLAEASSTSWPPADPGGERPGGARGDRRVHRPARRQPSRPQLRARRGRRLRGAAGGDADEDRRFGSAAARRPRGAPRLRASGSGAWTSAAIGREVRAGGDAALLRLTARFDGTCRPPRTLASSPGGRRRRSTELAPALGVALEIDRGQRARDRGGAARRPETAEVEASQGPDGTVPEIPVAAAGIYAPGGRRRVPVDVLMSAIPARRRSGAGRVCRRRGGGTSPGGAAAAALCGVDEISAMGGAQAIAALAYGTETIAPVAVIAGPGNATCGGQARGLRRGRDRLLAGPSELMMVAGHEPTPSGRDRPLRPGRARRRQRRWSSSPTRSTCSTRSPTETALRAERPPVADARMALVRVATSRKWSARNAFAPEHLSWSDQDPPRVASASGMRAPSSSAASGVAFGDYVVGSNHILPTGGTAASGGLGPANFLRRVSEVRIASAAAAQLAKAGRTNCGG